MAGLDLSTVKFPDTMDLRNAAIYTGMSEMRVRTLARNGELKASKDAETSKWQFKKADLDAFKNTPRERKAGGPRGSGKSFIIVVPHDAIEKTKAALAPLQIQLQPRYNYAAQKEYRAKRKAAGKTTATKAPVAAAQAAKK